ncbi:MAG: Aerobic-type carbon monoxide dehydrogenase, large subunit CoxL/CutL homologs [uncultured Caballeronia sp.]|nr:MAG: Aerobic-type carbon monoxide dehydrogenase, large subunit CoxL/CutL homologs [uncultured Caballeronia sp.]
MYGDGRPVRLAFDRYEQFQTSIKRHASKMRYRIAIDKKTNLLQSFTRSNSKSTAAGAAISRHRWPWWGHLPRSRSTTSRRAT